MRQQYHFRQSDKGLLAWDVHRLIELSKDFPIINVPLKEIIELEEEYWFQSFDGKPTCKAIAAHSKLIQEVDPSFPIILFSDGRVADGMHRVCRMWMEDSETIQAVKFPTDPKPDYVGIHPKDLPY